MTVEHQTIDGRIICKVSGALCIWEVAAAWTEMAPLLSSAAPLEIDLSDVDQCDGSGVQILCQIQRIINKKQKAITVTGLSNSVQSAILQAGLNQDVFKMHSKGN